MTEREKQAYNYATERLQDPCFPEYNWESEIVDAHIEGQDYMIEKACEWFKKNTYSLFSKSCSLFDAVEEFVENFKQEMEGGEK